MVERAPSLTALRQELKAAIDAYAGATRMRFITDTPGQQWTYIIKAQQAVKYLADSALIPTTTVPPYIAGEARATGASASAAATAIVSAFNNWNTVVGPGIEEIRIRSKLAVDACVDQAALDAAWLKAMSDFDKIYSS